MGSCVSSNDFFGERLLLGSDTAVELYREVRDMPVIDPHCHLNEKDIKNNRAFDGIGELWLDADHYKWRAMRMCGIDEKYITGDATPSEKFSAYASIMPKLCGNPLYYWSQMELGMLFGINQPLNAQNATRIEREANGQLSGLKTRDLLKRFNVEYIATTDDPVSDLSFHGDFDGIKVRPTFRPDRFLVPTAQTAEELREATGLDVTTVDGYVNALTARLDFFRDRGCVMTDHGMDFLPVKNPGSATASELYRKFDSLSFEDSERLRSYILNRLAGAYADRGMIMQIHFGTFRNVNSACFASVGRDAGFDIMRGFVDTDRLAGFFDGLNQNGSLPRTVLYSLNPECMPSVATVSGAFRNIRVGAAWWFNDSVSGIRRQLETIAEYASLGTCLGMLTDSRSFTSYVRFDFFRRILADFVAGYVDRGEYDAAAAGDLMRDVCYGNIKDFMGI